MTVTQKQIDAIQAAVRAYIDAKAGMYANWISNEMCRAVGIVAYQAGAKVAPVLAPPKDALMSAIDADAMLQELNSIIAGQIIQLQDAGLES